MLIQLYLRIERLGTPRAVTDFVYACAYYALQIVAPRVLFPGLWVEEDAAIEQHNQDMQARWEQLTRDVQRRRVQAFEVQQSLKALREDFLRSTPQPDLTLVTFLDDTLRELERTRQKDFELLTRAPDDDQAR